LAEAEKLAAEMNAVDAPLDAKEADAMNAAETNGTGAAVGEMNAAADKADAGDMPADAAPQAEGEGEED
jgi:hypothetical protein